MQRDPTNLLEQERTKEELFRRFSKVGRARSRARRLIRGAAWLLLIRLTSGAKRLLDFFVAVVLLILSSPLLIGIIIQRQVTGSPVFALIPRIGRWCEEFNQLSFAPTSGLFFRVLNKTGLAALPVLFNIVKGEMSFIGPRAVSAGELSPQDRVARRRYDIRPGLIGLWWLRQRGNIAYESEARIDQEYVESQSVWGDIGIALRAIPAVLYGRGASNAPDALTLLGIPIRNLTMTEAVGKITEWLDDAAARQVCFINADCANVAYRNPDYLSVLREADLSLADGIGLKLAGKLLGREIKQNVNGTDMFPRLCESLANSGHSLYLLGARAGIAESVCDWIARNYPGTRVAGLHHGYYSPGEEARIVQDIAESGAALLLVAFGAPRQDQWIRTHLAETRVKVAMGVGGLFDFYSGRIPRAPQWMRDIGFEWIYRLYQEPGRMWKRYLVGNAVFMFRVASEKFFQSSKPSQIPSCSER